MSVTILIGISILILLCLWLYTCIGVVKENRHQNINSFGRFARSISGNRNKLPDENGELKIIPANQPRNKKKFFFIFRPFEKPSWYDFVWSGKKTLVNLQKTKSFVLNGEIFQVTPKWLSLVSREQTTYAIDGIMR